MKKPKFVTEEQLTYLDDLREGGSINMFGAAPILQEEFDLTKMEAKELLKYWMETFSARKYGKSA